MEHPLINDISNLTVEELQTKISDLNKKLAFATQTGNQAMVSQIQLVLGSYNQAYRTKIDAMMPKDGKNKYSSKIDIAK